MVDKIRIKDFIFLLIAIIIILTATGSSLAQYGFSTAESEYWVIDLESNTVFKKFPYAVQHAHPPLIMDQNGSQFVARYDVIEDRGKHGDHIDVVHYKICAYDNSGKLLVSNIEAIDAIVPQKVDNKIIIYLQGAIVDNPGPSIITGIGIFNINSGKESLFKFDPPFEHFRGRRLHHQMSYNLSNNHIYLYLKGLDVKGKIYKFDSADISNGYQETEGGLIYSDDNRYSIIPNKDGIVYKDNKENDIVLNLLGDYNSGKNYWLKNRNILFSRPFLYDAENKQLIDPHTPVIGKIRFYDRTTDRFFTSTLQSVKVSNLIPNN